MSRQLCLREGGREGKEREREGAIQGGGVGVIVMC